MTTPDTREQTPPAQPAPAPATDDTTEAPAKPRTPAKRAVPAPVIGLGVAGVGATVVTLVYQLGWLGAGIAAAVGAAGGGIYLAARRQRKAAAKAGRNPSNAGGRPRGPAAGERSGGFLGLLRRLGEVRHAARAANRGGAGAARRAGGGGPGAGRTPGRGGKSPLGALSRFGRSLRGGGSVAPKRGSGSGARGSGRRGGTGARAGGLKNPLSGLKNPLAGLFGRRTGGKSAGRGAAGRGGGAAGARRGGGSGRAGAGRSSGGSLRRVAAGLGRLFGARRSSSSTGRGTTRGGPGGGRRRAGGGGARSAARRAGPGGRSVAGSVRRMLGGRGFTPKRLARARRALRWRAFLAGLLGRPAPATRGTRQGGGPTRARPPAAVRRPYTAGRLINRAARLAGRGTRRVARPVGRGAARVARRAAASRPARHVAAAGRRIGGGFVRRVAAPFTARRRGAVWRRAANVARNQWQEFLRGTGLVRSPVYRKAAEVARNAWTDFLLGTGLLDPDSARWNAHPHGATPGAKPLTPPTPDAPTGAGQPSPPAARRSITGGSFMARIGSEKVQVLPPILQGAQEAFEQACDQFHCVNANDERAANAARQFLQELAEFAEAVGVATGRVGDKVTEEIYLEPGAADVFHQIGHYLGAPKDDIEEAAEAIDAAHEDDLRRLENPDERADAWDYRPNRIGY